MNSKYDIIIVGLGPVGLFAANIFGAKGWNVLAIEQHEERWKYPRAIGMDDEILRALQSIDILSAVLPQTKTIKGLQLLHGKNKVFFTLANPKDGDFEKGPYLFYQPEFESILESGANRFSNVTIRYNCELKNLKQGDNSVNIECATKYSNKDHEIFRSQFLLGCDGAKSTVRRLLNISEKSLNYDGYILKVDAKAKDLSKFDFNLLYAQKYCSTKRAWVRMIGHDNHCRWEFQFKGSKVDPDALSHESALKYINEAGDDIENIELINTAFYRFRSVVQEKWRIGNAVIAGDAAHLTPPYIGQGMCGGIRDIVNLSWKLESIKEDKFSTKLLDTYQSERSPHMKHMIRIAIAVGYIFKTKLYLLLLLLKKGLFYSDEGKEFNPKVPKLGKGFFSRRRLARGIFPQFILKNCQAESIYSDDFIGTEWALISLMLPSSEEMADLKKLGIKSLNFNENSDAQGKINNWLKCQKVKAILLRPDKYIFSSGNLIESILKDFKKLQIQYQK